MPYDRRKLKTDALIVAAAVAIVFWLIWLMELMDPCEQGAMMLCACLKCPVGAEVERRCPRSGYLICEDHSLESCMRVTFDTDELACVSSRLLGLRLTPPPHRPWLGTSDLRWP